MWAVLLLGIMPGRDVLVDRVDVIELNHFHDGDCKLVFDQVIFWDFCYVRHHYVVRDWRLVKAPEHIPLPDYDGDRWWMEWHDAKDLYRRRRVEAQCFRETWTQQDPELADRENVPAHVRRGLKPVWWGRNEQDASADPE